jgi:DNA-binding CsgD family transcriptional regulator
MIVVVKNLVEIVVEFLAGESLWQMLDDVLLFLVGLLLLGLMLQEWLRQNRTIATLRDELNRARGQLAQLDSRGPDLGLQYREVMQKQFDAWQLTASEQEVVVLLLKGLSFREVATLRETREKTVRQQAASVYKKSGLAGRHELAAWFLEDLLDPTPR